MFRPKDLSGQTFGRLTVICDSGERKRRTVVWGCLCSCGNTCKITTYQLKSGNTKSCGCLRNDKLVERRFIHGKSNTQLYCAWSDMIKRCYNPKFRGYHRYGGRGITVCDKWKDKKIGFDSFSKDMGGIEITSMTLDRIDNNGGYTPENCRWTNRREQANNREDNYILFHNGEQKTVSEWSRAKGIKRSTLMGRIDKGWTTDAALTTPVQKRSR